MRKNLVKKSLKTVFAAALMFFCFSIVNAQTWNSNAGGYNGGYGQVYSTFGLAMATKNMQDSMNMTMQKTMMRMAMEKKWGKKAVAEAERNAARQSSSTRNQSSSNNSNVQTVKTPVVRNYAFFKPDASVDTGKVFADNLGETAEEKALLKQIYSATKTAFEAQVAPKGWKNNYAAGLTFFIVTAATVYHDAEEPGDQAVENLFKSLNQTIDESPDFGEIPNREKQEFYNKMIGFSGLILATYTEGKENNDEATVKTASQLAGILIQLILKTSPEKVRFENDLLVIG